MDYRQAGVDIEAGRSFVAQIRHLVEKTRRPEVIGGLGGFGGSFQLPSGYQQPVLVSSTDGVGTKLKIAQALNRHDTVGLDLVAMCVNDVVTAGAEPLFFLDYLATGKLQPDQLTQVVAGIAEGCRLSGCALLGGETAEMPGFYSHGEYDLAGFCVGIVEKSQLLDGSKVQVGDVVIGLASQGLHSNGFSLVRKILADRGGDWSDRPAPLAGKSIGEEVLTPTRIYVESVLAARRRGLDLHAMAHITGGGLPENLPRCLGPGQSVRLFPNSWEIPAIFPWLAEVGGVNAATMYETFNMGVGFVVLVPPEHRQPTLDWFAAQKLSAWVIGEVMAGEGKVIGLPE